MPGAMVKIGKDSDKSGHSQEVKPLFHFEIQRVSLPSG